MSRPPLGDSLNIFGLSIPWYSLLIMIAILIGLVLASREEKRMGLPKDTVINYVLVAIPAAIVGARLYYVIFSWQRYSGNIMEIFRIWNGGLALYGGVIAAMLVAFLMTRRRKALLPSLLDACAPSIALGQSIGRWGNYANMEAYGARIYDAAGQFFPNAVEIRLIGADGTEYWYWHMATFFYESVWCFVIFLLLWTRRKRAKRRGDVMLWYVLLYCAGRTVIEGLRDDSLMMNVAAAQVRISQILSAIACIAVLVVFFVRLFRTRKLHLADYLCWVLIALGTACAFVGEFERNAYQMLFLIAQGLMGAMLIADIVFFIHYFARARRLNGPAIWMIVVIALCALTLVLGIGRLGASNTAYIALRQSVAMLHLILCGGWFYLRVGAPRKQRAQAAWKEHEHAA